MRRKIKAGQAQEIYRADIKPGIAKRAFIGALDEISRVWALALDTEYTVEETISQIIAIYLAGKLAPPSKLSCSCTLTIFENISRRNEYWAVAPVVIAKVFGAGVFFFR